METRLVLVYAHIPFKTVSVLTGKRTGNQPLVSDLDEDSRTVDGIHRYAYIDSRSLTQDHYNLRTTSTRIRGNVK